MSHARHPVPLSPAPPNRFVESHISVAPNYMPLLSGHVQDFGSHDCCEVCSDRCNRCFVRGSIPCEVLYIGEAPGDSEDVKGLPFFGPAGKLLDDLIAVASSHAFPCLSALYCPCEGRLNICANCKIRTGIRSAFGNLLACIPKTPAKDKTRPPTAKEIKACQPRLIDLVNICQPRLVVLCGLLPQKHFPKHLLVRPNRIEAYAEILHPSSILRAQDDDPQGAALAYKRMKLTLSTAFGKLLP